MTKTKTPKSGAANMADDTNYVTDTIDVTVTIYGEATAPDAKAIAAATAEKLIRPEVSAASIISKWQKDTHNVNAVVDTLAKEIEAVNGGNLARAEGILIAQAHALDNIFTNLARRATTQEYMKQWEAYMRMAMKAQNQCRMTLETLASVKHPPMVFAKQANINNGGQQQVNNGAPPAATGTVTPNAGAASSASAPTELLGASNGQWLDAGATGATGGADSILEAVGAVHRSQDA